MLLRVRFGWWVATKTWMPLWDYVATDDRANDQQLLTSW